jgi:hypothetical protein
MTIAEGVTRGIPATNKPCGCAKGQKCKVCLYIPEDGEEAIPMVEPGMTTTAFELPGHVITRNLGVVQGLTVRSRSFLGAYGAAWQAMAGGEVTLFSKMCEQSRQEAFIRVIIYLPYRESGARIRMP